MHEPVAVALLLLLLHQRPPEVWHSPHVVALAKGVGAGVGGGVGAGVGGGVGGVGVGGGAGPHCPEAQVWHAQSTPSSQTAWAFGQWLDGE